MGLKLNQSAVPSPPSTNKLELYYDTDAPGVGTNPKLAAIDEHGNVVIVGGFVHPDYRLIKVVQKVQGDTTYTPTDGVNALYVECIGAGGAGGGAATSSANCSLGGGGSGGAYSAVWLTGAAIKSSYACVIGAGGTPGSAGAAGGDASADTTFDSPSVCTAKKGLGGAVLAAGTSLITQLGAVGGLASSGVGDLKMDGCDGGFGVRLSASAGISGSGGAAPLGSGIAKGVNATLTAGNTGKVFGGGGSGAFTATTAQQGGAGANGIIRIWEFS